MHRISFYFFKVLFLRLVLTDFHSSMIVTSMHLSIVTSANWFLHFMMGSAIPPTNTNTTLSLGAGKHDTFGEEMRLSRKRHTSGDPDEYTSGYGVKALSYCDLHAVTLTDLMAVLDDYPEFADDFLRQLVVTFSIQHEVRSADSLLHRTS